MFESNFSFDNKDYDTISEELRKLLVDTGIHPNEDDYGYLQKWKDKLMSLSGNN